MLTLISATSVTVQVSRPHYEQKVAQIICANVNVSKARATGASAAASAAAAIAACSFRKLFFFLEKENIETH